MRAGAYDYLLKPVQFDDVLMKVQRALEFGQLSRTQRVITEQLAEQSTFHNLVGNAKAMTKLFEVVKRLSDVKSNVVIRGRKRHRQGTVRPGHPLQRPDPRTAFRARQLRRAAGHPDRVGTVRLSPRGVHRGGAGQDRVFRGGQWRHAFLDEISTLPLGVQSSLLRVLEDKVVVPVGDTPPAPDRRADHRRLQSGFGKDGRGQAVPRRPAVPAERGEDSTSRPCAARRTSRCWSIISSTNTPGR